MSRHFSLTDTKGWVHSHVLLNISTNMYGIFLNAICFCSLLLPFWTQKPPVYAALTSNLPEQCFTNRVTTHILSRTYFDEPKWLLDGRNMERLLNVWMTGNFSSTSSFLPPPLPQWFYKIPINLKLKIHQVYEFIITCLI